MKVPLFLLFINIFTNKHIENIFDIEDSLLAKTHVFAKKVALAYKEVYKCEGITIRQNNGQPEDQDLWHYHLHVFPRFTGDNINQTPGLRQLTDPKDRVFYAERLKQYFRENTLINH